MTQEQLPIWLKVSSKCWYFSESQKTLHPVVVTSIDAIKRRIVVHFEANHSVWKTIPFDLVGRNGSLRPPDSNAGAQTEDKNGLTQKDKKDGTSTPPWYERLVMTSTHTDQVKEEEEKRKQQDLLAQQERRRYAWLEAKRRQQEEEQQAREMERIRVEEQAEAARILIVQKLQREREEEMRRQQEVHAMEVADEACSKVNIVWRKQELARRRQEEEERQAEEEEEQRLAEEQYQKDLAARPRVSFGVKMKQEPARLFIPRHSSTTPGDENVNGTSADRHPNDASEVVNTEAYICVCGVAIVPDDMFCGNCGTKRFELPVCPEALQEEADLEPEPPMEFPSDAEDGVWPEPTSDRGPSAPPRPSPTMALPTTRAVPSSIVAEPSHEEQFSTVGEWYHARVRAIYEEHNPSKLAEVPSLMEKYACCQAEMYERICTKYGVQPEEIPSYLQSRTRSRSRQHRQRAEGASSWPLAVPKSAAVASRVGYAKKASAPPPMPQVFKPSRIAPSVAPSCAPGIAAPSSSPHVADTSTSTLRARFNTLLDREKKESDGEELPDSTDDPGPPWREENDHEEPLFSRDGHGSPEKEASSPQRDSQRRRPTRDDDRRRGRSDSRQCHREERREASSSVGPPRPPTAPPPSQRYQERRRQESDYKDQLGGRDRHRSPQQEVTLRRRDSRRRSHSRHCHREDRREKAASWPGPPRPPREPPPPPRNGSRNRDEEWRNEDFQRRRSESRCSRDHSEWKDRRDERSARGRNYDEQHQDRGRGDRAFARAAPPNRSRSHRGDHTQDRGHRSRSHRGNDTQGKPEPPWREERRGTEPWHAANSRSTGHRGPYDGGHRNNRSYDGY